jgi:hypothetical protein
MNFQHEVHPQAEGATTAAVDALFAGSNESAPLNERNRHQHDQQEQMEEDLELNLPDNVQTVVS